MPPDPPKPGQPPPPPGAAQPPAPAPANPPAAAPPAQPAAAPPAQPAAPAAPQPAPSAPAAAPAAAQPSPAKAAAQGAAQAGQQAAAAQAAQKCPQFFTQEKSNSCVIASSRNIIKELTGKDVPESQLRNEMSTIIGDPNHDWQKQGTNPKNAVKLLEQNGVKAKALNGAKVSNDDLANLTAKKPVMIGFQNPGHRVILDSVTVAPDGTKTYNVKDPAGKYKGNVRQMTEAEFNQKRNPKAVVIVPE